MQNVFPLYELDNKVIIIIIIYFFVSVFLHTVGMSKVDLDDHVTKSKIVFVVCFSDMP